MGTTKYTIKPGDNLSTIAKRFNTTVGALQSANGISNPNLIIAGKTLTIPSYLPQTTANGGSTATTGYTYTPFEYEDFVESDETIAAGQKKTDAENAVANRGEYGWVGDEKLNEYISQWENRPDFSYDFNADALYQQYKDKYIQQGKMAMADTIGQASAMTGGYGNSYAQSVGQQTYNAHLEQLNDVIPELYQMAYDRYNQQGQDLLNTISLLRGERDFDYGKWSDETNRLIADRGYYGDEYYNLYGRDYTKYTADRSLAQGEHTNEENMGYANYRDAIADEQWAKNYALSERELKMAEEAWELEKNSISSTGGGSGSGSGGGSGGGGGKEEEPVTPTESKATNSFIANHQTKDEYMRRGKNYKQYKAYIEGEINKIEKSLSDAELMYLIQYYGL